MPNPASSHNHRLALPTTEPSTTAAACADLAALTVRIFTPDVTNSIRDIFSRNPSYSPSEHLPLLGTLVVRHVALSLAENVPCENKPPNVREAATSPKPSRVASSRKLSTRKSQPRKPRRSSYRDLGYEAVRQRKIFPEAVELQPGSSSDPASSTYTSIPRRISITLAEPQADPITTKNTRSVASVRFSQSPQPLSPQPSSPEPHPEFFRQSVSISPVRRLQYEDVGGTAPVVRKGKSTASWKEADQMLFPRADVSSSIRTESRLAGQQRLRAEVESSREEAGLSDNAPKRVSKLVQLRKQRLDRKGKSFR